jgi:nitrogen fixation protein FixH
MTGDKKSAWRSPWVIAWVGLVLIVLSVNLVMVYLAIGHNPGLVMEDYYERGKNHEETLFKRLARDPGWRMEILAPDTIPLGQATAIRFRMLDRQEQPVASDRVTLFAYRPSDARQDFSVAMQPESPGIYWAAVRFPLKGVWDLVAAVRQGDDEFNAPLRIRVGMNDPR